jgi:putative endonuclease
MYVYILRSTFQRDQLYVGVTPDVKERLAHHNAGQSRHTSKFMPWELECYFWFADEGRAFRFEQYLKSGSGRAFRNRHF